MTQTADDSFEIAAAAHRSLDFAASIDLYARLQLPAYVRLAQSHEKFRICLNSASPLTIDEATSKIREEAISAVNSGSATPFDIMLIVYLLIYYENFSTSYIQAYFQKLIDSFKEYDSLFLTSFQSWSNYLLAAVNIREILAQRDYRNNLANGYAFNLSGQDPGLMTSAETMLASGADTHLALADCNVATCADPLLSSLIRQARLALGRIWTSATPVGEGNPAEANDDPRRQFSSFAAAIRSQLNGEMTGRAYFVGQPDKPYVASILPHLRRSGSDDEQPVCIHEDGTHRTEAIVAWQGMLRRLPQAHRFPPALLYHYDHVEVLDDRGQIRVGRELLLDSSIWGSCQFHAGLADLGGHWDLMPTFGSAVPLQSENYSVAVTRRSEARLLEVEGGVIAIADNMPTVKNHAHWLLDGLPRLLAAVEADDKARRPLLFSHPTPSQRASMTAIGIDPDSVIVPEPDYPIALRDVVLPLPSWLSAGNQGGDSCIVNPALMRRLRDRLARNLDGRPPGRLRAYIGRRKRTVINREEIEALLAQRGFTSVDPTQIDHGGLDFAGQQRLFFDIDVLVMAGGAGLANMIFMRPGSTVIALYDQYLASPMYSFLAEILGIHYVTVVGRPHSFDAIAGAADFSVDPADLGIALDYTDHLATDRP